MPLLPTANEGAVHMLGKISQRADLDIAHMRYYLGPLKLKYHDMLYVTC